jgi:hypothetical protein
MSDPCSEWISLSDRQALEQALSDAERAFLAEHAARCASCSAEAAVWRGMAALVQDSPDAPALAPSDAARSVRTSSLRSSRRRALAFACAALAACLVLGLPLRGPERPRATTARSARATQPIAARGMRVTSTSGGQIEVDGRPTSAGASVPVGALLFARTGSACLTVEPGVRACLARGSLLRVSELSRVRRRLELLAGKIGASLDPQPPGESFGITTRDGSAVAVGTAFSVEMPADDGPVITRVVHGSVLVRSAEGVEQQVGARRMASMRGAARPLPANDELRERALLDQVGGARGTRPGVLHITSLPPGSEVTIDGRPAGVTPLSLLLDSGDYDVTVGTAPAAMWRERLHVAAGEAVSRTFERPPAAQQTQTASAPERERALDAGSRQSSASQLLVAARERRASGNVDGALHAYRALFRSHGQSREALAARVAYAEILLARGVDPADALVCFDYYLTRGGPLEKEARFGRIRALRALEREVEERAATQDFLRRFPEGPIADALRARHHAQREP